MNSLQCVYFRLLELLRSAEKCCRFACLAEGDFAEEQISSEVPRERCALKISALSHEFALECKDFSFVSLFADFKRLQVAAGDPYLLSGAFELFIKGLAEKTGQLFNTEVKVTDYAVPIDPASYRCHVSFYLCFQERKFPCVLYFKSFTAADDLCSALKKSVPVCSVREDGESPADGDLKTELSIIAASCTLSFKELASLRVLDAVLSDRAFSADALLVRCGKFQCQARLCEDGRLQLTSCFVELSGDSSMSENAEDTNNPETDNGSEENMRQVADSLPVELIFELERQTLSLAELKELKKDSMLDLANQDFSSVNLVACGRVIAKGRLAECGNRCALQITEIVKSV